MAYVDPNTVHNPSTGTVAPAAWGDTIRDDLEFLVDPPVCAVKATSAQSVGASSNTVLTAGTETFDNDTMHSTVTNTSRITIQTAGRYLVFPTVRFAAASGGARVVHLQVNGGTPVPVGAFVADAALGTDVVISGSKPFTFAATDYVEVVAFQSTAGSLNVTLEDFTVIYITR